MQSDHEARRCIAAQLLREATALEAGREEAVGSGLEAFEAYAARAHGHAWNDPALGAAYTFWDCWLDARNHDWRFYPRLRSPEQWARLAREVAAALEAGLDPSDLVRRYIG